MAAGLGTRLMPLTENKPKVLMEVNGVPLLRYIIHKLSASGFDDIVINIHHFAARIVDFVENERYSGIRVRFSDEREKLLDTGGAILHARELLEDAPAFLVYNGDILSNLDLNRLYLKHFKEGNLATLAVKERETTRNFLFNKENQLIGWKNEMTGEILYSKNDKVASSLAFSGIHVISSRIFELFTESDVFSMTGTYLRLARFHQIKAFIHNEDDWMDIGSIERLRKTQAHVKEHGFP